jgi:hypothetical protein
MINIPMLPVHEFREEQDRRINAVESRFGRIKSKLTAKFSFSTFEIDSVLTGLMNRHPGAIRDLHTISNSINSLELRNDAHEAFYLIGCLSSDDIQQIKLPTV